MASANKKGAPACRAHGFVFMKIIIVGDGKVGFSLAQQLSKEDHDVVIIDNNAKVLADALDKLDVMVVEGNGASLKTQKQAGVANGDLLIAATSSDEINLLSCIIANKLGCRHAISRLRNPEYTEQLSFLHDELGLSMTVNPELASAREMFGILQFPSFLKRDTFAKGRVELVSIRLKSDSELIGKSLEKAAGTLLKKALVCAVERKGEIIVPNGSFVFEEDDTLSVTAPRNELAKLIKKLHIEKHKIRSVMIIGGSRMAMYLAQDLIRSGVSVKIIEIDEARCMELADKLPEAIIIHGDGTSQELLLEEGIDNTDAVVSLADIDEENIIITMYANTRGVFKTITKINRTEYSSLFGSKGLGSIISPKQLTTNAIVRYVRAMGNTTGGQVLALHRIVEDKVEALEFFADERTENLGIPLSQLNLRSGILIACLNRSGQIIIPGGSDCINAGDTVIVIAKAERILKNLNDIFESEF